MPGTDLDDFDDEAEEEFDFDECVSAILASDLSDAEAVAQLMELGLKESSAKTAVEERWVDRAGTTPVQ